MTRRSLGKDVDSDVDASEALIEMAQGVGLAFKLYNLYISLVAPCVGVP